MNMSRRSFLGLTALSAGFALHGCKKKGTETSETDEGQDLAPIATETLIDVTEASGTHHATITVKDYGTIKLELYGDQAPITVGNFMELASKGFYDGLTFHRIIAGFMIQGGDPYGNGMGGSGRPIKGEFYANGVTNVIPHQRGVISMARASDYNSASSQFFIVHQDSMDSLDGKYAAFGRVTEGIEVVDAIAENTKVEDANGTVAPENQPIIESITIDD